METKIKVTEDRSNAIIITKADLDVTTTVRAVITETIKAAVTISVVTIKDPNRADITTIDLIITDVLKEITDLTTDALRANQKLQNSF